MTITRLFVVLFFVLASTRAHTQENLVLLVGTTIESSGLLKQVRVRVQKDTGIELKAIAMGTGRALATARRGDADVLIVHDPRAEQVFMDEGYGKSRTVLMVNDFILVGPEDDPAGIRQATSVEDAFSRLGQSQHLFLSRGDDSGTNQMEREAWSNAKVNVDGQSWYRETGGGMGATLNTAVGLGAYTLSDRATWVAFRNKEDMAVLFEAPDKLPNIYSYIIVDSQKFPHVKNELAKRFQDWLLSDRFRDLIDNFRPHGEPVFFSVRR